MMTPNRKKIVLLLGALLANVWVFANADPTTNASAAAAPAAPPRPPPPPLPAVKQLIFGKGAGSQKDLRAEYIAPENTPGPWPVLVYVHGGGWTGNGYSNPRLLKPFADHGYFAISIEYVVSYYAPWPRQIQDCKLAIRYLRAHAAELNIDPKRIGVLGDSAGGHLVACLGTMDGKEYEGDGGYPEQSSAVQAVIDWFGPTDFMLGDDKPAPQPPPDPSGKPKPKAISNLDRLFGGPRTEKMDVWKSGSPVYFVKPNDPPMLIMHGDIDSVVPLQHSIVFDAALTKAGVPHQFVIVKNSDHEWSGPHGHISPTIPEIMQMCFDFLDKYLKGATHAPATTTAPTTLNAPIAPVKPAAVLMLSLLAQVTAPAAPSTPAAQPAPATKPAPPAPPPRPPMPPGVTPLQYGFAQMNRYAVANSQLPPLAEGEKRVVFFGDSITDNWKGKDFFPDKNYIDRGISGQTTTQMMVRFPYDVAALHPTVVVILAGTNDIAQNMGPITLGEITHNIGELAAMAQSAGIRPIVCSILPSTEFWWHKGMEPAEKIQKVNQMVQDWCNAHQVAYLDYYSAMADANHGLPKTLSGDGVHPNSAGYAIMSPLAEAAIEKALAQGPVTPPPAQ